MTVSVTCDCTSMSYPVGYSLDTDTGLWVHHDCGRPTALYLDAMYRKAELGQNRAADSNDPPGRE